MGLAFVDIGAYDIDPNAATAALDRPDARRYTVLPIKVQDDELVVAMADPANIFAIDDLRIVTGKEIRPVVAAESDLAAAIDKFSRIAEPTSTTWSATSSRRSRGSSDEDDEDEAGEESAVARLMNQIITEAIRQGAGDIYIEPMETRAARPVPHRRRVPGGHAHARKKLHRQLHQPSQDQLGHGHRRAAHPAGRSFRRRARRQGGRLPRRGAAASVDGEMAVMRLLRRDSIMMSLKDLGFLEQNLRALLDALALPYGAILVTGPTGSGKSTTLYAAINETNDPKTNLITVEDPVEYRLAGLSQVQVHEKAGLTFAAALRSILRQDPDKVMIGEIRDKETGTIAIEAALTGHLVLSTLHTNDAPSAITRLTEMGIEPFLSASAITLRAGPAPRAAAVSRLQGGVHARGGGARADRVPVRAGQSAARCTARGAARSATASATRAGWASTRS